MPRISWLVLASLAGSACRPAPPVSDPFQDALHVPRIGHTVPTLADVPADAEPDDGPPDRATPGRYGGDLDDLQNVIEARWASRERHESLDGVDVDATFDGLRKEVGRSTTLPELASDLRTALCRLGDAHLRVVDASMDARPLDSGLRVSVVGGADVIAQVDSRYDDSAFTPRRGDLVVTADGEPIGDLHQRQCLRPGSTPAQREHLAAESLGRQARGTDDPPLPATIGVRRNGRTRTVKLKWKPAADAPAGPCVKGNELPNGVGRLDIDSFACGDEATFDQQLQQALDVVADARDIVIDLRRNAGGDDAAARAAATRFVAKPTTWMRFRHAGSDAPATFSDEPFVPQPGRVVAADRIWVLTGPGCFSTCEIFASVLAAQPNVTLVGTPTAGGVGNPEPYRLSRSGLAVTIPRTVYALPGTDSPIEGAGVPVDVEVRATLDDVAKQRDAVLEAALTRIAERRR